MKNLRAVLFLICAVFVCNLKANIQEKLPFQAGLIIFRENIQKFCGGSLISPFFVLSAAHCTFGAKKIQVILGANNYKENEKSQVVVTTKLWNNHEQFNNTDFTNDISLIKLPYKILLNQQINTIKIGRNTKNTNIFYSGWPEGTKNNNGYLKVIKVKILTNNICGGIYKNIKDSNICTISNDNNSTGCYGFSGGPLIENNKQIGIVSYGSKNCDKSIPIVHVNLLKYFKWIKRNMEFN
ncbi:unnamed protein product [Brassicogethes aeneus]|uniref:Peptidase S1 domain-containing protein n=1 Tax=Brassicogethes aeneus TaxID=1431903 RepID=A0A9P0ATL5_BRAAE|nr:unnamed protein product [Brassicogethes aeneus]